MPAVSSPPVKGQRKPHPIEAPAILRWWHLFSLDAPTVAVLWAFTFAHSFSLSLPFSSLAILGLGTWLVYIADRLLDGWHTLTVEEQRERHFFYQRHFLAMSCTAITILPILGWLIFTRMPGAERKEDTVLSAVALLYLLGVHSRTMGKWLSKEFLTGSIFALATAVPTWSRLAIHPVGLDIGVLFFAIVCWLNCRGIERWESPEPDSDKTFPLVLNGIAMAGLALTVLEFSLHMPARAIFLAATSSILFLLLLEKIQKRLTTILVRIAADLALLTPVFAVARFK